MCVWGIRNGTLSYRAGIPKGWRREGVVTEREPEPYTQLYQRTEWAPQQSGRENEKEPEVHQCKRLRRGGITALWPVWDTYETLKKVGTLGR